MPIQWTTTPEKAWVVLAERYSYAIHLGVRVLANRRKVDIEAWMKQNAPWTDRTSNARQTLNTEVNDLIGSAVEIYLAHGMDYGIFLELAHGGQWAIIGPAIDYWSPIIWADVRTMMS